jgi:short subunit dehydrogenase-like uncharacterized protein
MAKRREFDVILLGPTGVTGREVARYLSGRAGELSMTWAVAGRNAQRMRDALAVVGAAPAEVIVADVHDGDAMRALAARTTVIANLVGPYALYGNEVYEACVQHGTHQVDLTGETDWVHGQIALHQDAAMSSGANIVPSCGFESLPFDLGVLAASTLGAQRFGELVVEADVAVAIHSSGTLAGMSDAVSGGTYTSGVEAMKRGGGASVTDPFILDDAAGSRVGDRVRYHFTPRRHSGTGAWLGPVFPSPFLNPPVVHRGASLQRGRGSAVFAPNFVYREGTVAASMVPLSGTVGRLGSSSVGRITRLGAGEFWSTYPCTATPALTGSSLDGQGGAKSWRWATARDP